MLLRDWNLTEQSQVSLWIERNPIHGPCSEAILKMDLPKDKASVERLRSTVNYHSRFLPKLSELMQPTSNLTRPDDKWIWDSVHDSAFN